MTTHTRACTQCGKRKHRCTCAPHRPTYDYQHQTMRVLLLPYAIGSSCPLCGQVMRHEDKLDLDHTTNAITHASCNRRAGATITNRGGGRANNATTRSLPHVGSPGTELEFAL